MDHKILRGLITGGAVIAIITHAFLPTVTVDVITLGFLTIAVLPWVAPIISKVELPGGLKIELQKIEDKVNEATGAAQSATTKAATALAVSGAGVSAIRGPQAQQPNSAEVISSLTQQYNHIRETQPGGPMRTNAMTTVVGAMITVAGGTPDYDPTSDLDSRDGGHRLFAYAYLYARPDFNQLEVLVKSVVDSKNRPFEQYWGIQAIGRLLLCRGAGRVSPEIKASLIEFFSRLPEESDRKYELNQIISGL